MSINDKNDSKLGYTTTVKEQVDGIEVPFNIILEHNRPF